MRRLARTNFNTGWHFHFGEPAGGPGTFDTTASGWQPVMLPHSWNALDTMETDPAAHYRRGAGWYARDLPADLLPGPDRCLWLEVEAAAMRAAVFLNDRHVAEHAGGYTAFTVNLTPAAHGLIDTEALRLTCRVDNLPDPDLIPSDMSDFFLYGGLTRNLWLFTTGPARLDVLFFDMNVSDDAAQIALRGRLVGPVAAGLTLRVTLFSPQGAPVFDERVPVAGPDFTVRLPTVERPALWSPDNPALYRAEVRLEAGSETWDAVEERLGFRYFDFPPGGPFYLNGERLLLAGTHRHEDWAGRGAAVPGDLTRRELAMIRRAGFNFVRLGHYPQAPAVLDTCDELGLIVWEELPWCRGGVGGERFKSLTRTMLIEMIEQHYNRPSIIFWGLGNELDWESEHPGSSDARVLAFLQELHDLAHRLDPSRLTALRRFEPGAAVVDVYSPSIWSGWYRGRYQDYEGALTAAMDRYPRLLHMEWGGDSHIGRHGTGPHIGGELEEGTDHAELPGLALSDEGPPRASRDGDWSESYILDVIEWHLRVQQRLPRLAGTAQWAFKDFGTPLRPENPVPYVNQKGLVDRAGRPKDAYHLFCCYQTDQPVCYLESPTWPVRAGEPGDRQRVRVYSNCAQVELFLNGQSQGVKDRAPDLFPAAGLVWWVPLQEGENTLRAVGTVPGAPPVEHTIRQTFVPDPPGTPERFIYHSEPDRTPDGDPAVRVTVQLCDGAGRLVIDDRRVVGFALGGGGRLWVNRGTPDGCRTVQLANGRASALILAPSDDTRLVVTADGMLPVAFPVEA
jgi:beta-galactosidase